MFEKILEKIPVVSLYEPTKKVSQPLYLRWQGNLLKINKVGLHYTIHEGRTLIHVFCVVAGSLFFKLHFDTQGLTWTAMEVSDGTP